MRVAYIGKDDERRVSETRSAAAAAQSRTSQKIAYMRIFTMSDLYPQGLNRHRFRCFHRLKPTIMNLHYSFSCVCSGGVAQNGPSRDPYPSYDIVRTGKDALLVEMIGKSVKAKEKHKFTP